MGRGAKRWQNSSRPMASSATFIPRNRQFQQYLTRRDRERKREREREEKKEKKRSGKKKWRLDGWIGGDPRLSNVFIVDANFLHLSEAR